MQYVGLLYLCSSWLTRSQTSGQLTYRWPLPQPWRKIHTYTVRCVYMSECMSEYKLYVIKSYYFIYACRHEWMYEWLYEWVTAWLTSLWVSEWANMSASEWMTVIVFKRRPRVLRKVTILSYKLFLRLLSGWVNLRHRPPTNQSPNQHNQLNLRSYPSLNRPLATGSLDSSQKKNSPRFWSKNLNKTSIIWLYVNREGLFTLLQVSLYWLSELTHIKARCRPGNLIERVIMWLKVFSKR